MSFESDELTLSQSPFNDKIADFNDKKYVRIFRLEGRGAPAGEENTNDSLAIKRDRDIVESILGISDGTVVSKNPVIVDGTTITIPAGTQVYARGYVIELDTDATVTIAGSGNEYIGCDVIETYLTHLDDTLLTDQSQIYVDPETSQVLGPFENAGNPAGYAVKVELSFVANDGEYMLWKFANGILLNPETPYEGISRDLLEKYTNDISGNCSQKPIGAYVTRYDNSSSNANIPPNVFYVGGKRIIRIQNETVSIPHALEYESAGESNEYTTGTFEYELYEQPVKEVSTATILLEGYAQMTRGAVGDGRDTICTGTSSGNPIASMTPQLRGSLYSIDEVYTTTNGLYDGPKDVEYVIGTDADDDCFKSGNDIDWGHLSGDGATEPVAGSSYWVKGKFQLLNNAIRGVRTKQTITNEAVVIGGNNNVDLAHNDVFGLEDSSGVARVIIGDSQNGDDYTEGVDFSIINHLDDGFTNGSSDPNLAWTESDYAQIHWFITPPAGTVYVSYGYWVHTKEGHYISRNSFSEVYEPAINHIDDATTYKLPGFRNHISFRTATTEKPINASTISYTYNVYRGRKDLIEVNYDDTMSRVQGTSSENSKYPPGHNRSLCICKLDVPPDSSEILIDNQNVDTKTQPEIREMNDFLFETAERLEDVILSLGSQTKIVRNDAERGRFNESFTDLRPSLNGADLAFNRGGIAYSMRIDLQERCGRLAFANTYTDDLVPEVGSSNVNIGDRFITLNRSLASIAQTPLILKQLLATDFIRANPYGRFGDMGPYINLEPKQDNWIDTVITTINQNAGSETFNASVNGTRIGFLSSLQVDSWLLPITGSQLDLRNSTFGTTRTLDTAITEIRQRTVEVSGTQFTASADNIYLTFDGIQVTLTPTGTTEAGTNPGTVKSNLNGEWTAIFVIPSGVPTGTKKILAVETATNRTANSPYTAQGIRRDIINVIYTPPVIPEYKVDPIGQTFTPDVDYDIGAITVYCKQKDASEDAFVFVKTVMNGYPENNNIAFKSVPSSSISTSITSATGTDIVFDEPIPINALEQYFFGIGSKSSIYEFFYAKGGGTDLVESNRKVSENAYSLGAMFTSPDASSWQMDPISDLKFVVRPYVYSSTGTLEFENVTRDATSFIVCADYTTRTGTSLKWYYSLDNGTSWSGFEPNKVTRLSEIATQIKIKAYFTTSNTYASPILINGVTLETRLNSASGKYIGRNIANSVGNEFYKSHVCYEGCTPAGTTIVPYVSYDDGTSWISCDSPIHSQVLDGEYTKYWIEQVSNPDPPILDTNDLSETGAGFLAEATYYYAITATNSEGGVAGETLSSEIRSIAVTGASNSVTIDMTGNWPETATGYRLYRGTNPSSLTLKVIGNTTPTSIVDDGSDPNSTTDTPPAVATARLYQDNMRIRFDLTTSNVVIEPKIKNIFVIEE